MHILANRTGRIDAGEEAVDLAQTPADIVVLSAADTELAGFSAAVAALGENAPSVRLASLLALGHPYSVDLYVENTVRRSRLVLLRLLGGAGYWSYGLDRLIETARGHGLSLVVVPGDDRWDPDLAARSTVGLEAAERLWRYCVEGGAGNLANALRFAAHLIGSAEEPEPPRPLPPPTAPRRGPKPLPPEIASKIQKVSDTEFNVDRTVVDKILEDQAELMRSARIVPEQKDGKVVGVRLFGIRPDTLLGSLGLQNGDRLESINGFNMASPEKALEAYARLRTANNLNVKVNRRGSPVSIDYRIK